MVTVDSTRCVKCGSCADECPNYVFGSIPDANIGEIAVRYPEQCCACGHCVAICPENAIRHKEMPAERFEDIPDIQISPETMRHILLSRRSIRTFEETPVPRELVEQLVEAGIHAGTSSNGQTENFIILQDRSVLSELEELVIEVLWKAGLRYLGSGLGSRLAEMKYGTEMTRECMAYYHIIRNRRQNHELEGMIFRNAPVVVISHGLRANYLAHANCAIAARNMEILASATGLGACWAGFLTSAAHISRRIARYLGISTDRNVYGAIMAGYPKHKYRKRIPRKDREVRWI